MNLEIEGSRVVLRPLREATLTVAMVSHPGAYTDRAPAVEVSVPPDVHDRKVGTVMYLIAAFVEGLSGEREWDIAIEDFGSGRGRIILNLATESHQAAARALKLLQEVVRLMRTA
jgi:hypothetical protein